MGQIVTSFLILESPGPHSAYKIGYTRKGGEFGGEWMNVYVWLSLFDVYLKLSQHSQLATCMHAKSLQSYLTLCNPMDCRLPGSFVYGIPGKNTGVNCHVIPQRIFLNQGSNPLLLCLLHWKVGSLSLVPPGKPTVQYAWFKYYFHSFG